MTKTITPEVEAVRAVHAAAIRVIADLHAAYGKGVSMDIDATSSDLTWIHLYGTGEPLTLGFWDDGEMYVDGSGIVPRGSHLMVIEEARVFIHKHGHGAR